MKHSLDILCLKFIEQTVTSVFRTPTNAIDNNNQLKQETVRLFIDLQRRADSFDGAISEATNKGLFEHTTCTAEDCSAWSATARCTCKVGIHLVFEQLAQKIALAAAELTVPRTDHIVNEKTWTRGQCKSQLLTKVGQVALSKMAGCLHAAIFNASKRWRSIGSCDGELASKFEVVTAAANVYQSAKAVVVLIKHLHVCQILSGDEQLKEAAALHAKDANVPAPVKTEIGRWTDRDLHTTR